MSDAPETRVLRDPDGGLSLRLPRIRLVVVDGPDRGREIAPDRSVVRVGTLPEMEVVLSDSAVSRQHCRLEHDRGRIRVVDLGSANGTWVEGIRIKEADVPSGTLLRLGETTIRVTHSEDTVRVPLSSRERFGALLGKSVRMREAFSILERIAPTEATVLVEGESGTGKELAAEGLHAESRRAEGPFVVFDCGAVPHDLAESALFGHVRGAFTGAVSDRRGVFEEANGGTLFLDEIGELPLDLQPRLLRALEKREVKRVGGNATASVDVRIVSATNRSLEAEVNAGRFREDLFYRLAVVRVALPPLRARTDDIPLLVEHFLSRLVPAGTAPPKISGKTLATLQSRPWPGNVRELKNAVERAVAVTGASAFAPTGGTASGIAAPDVAGGFHEGRERAIEAFERAWIDAALRRSGGNVSAAAREAGVNRRLLQRIMKRLGMRVEDD